MQRGKRRLLVAAAVLYQCLLLGALAGTLVLALVALANGPVRSPVPFPPVVVETLAAVYVGGLVVWALILLWLAREWRKREHLKGRHILGRFIVLSLPVYGLLRLLRMCPESPHGDVQSGTEQAHPDA